MAVGLWGGGITFQGAGRGGRIGEIVEEGIGKWRGLYESFVSFLCEKVVRTRNHIQQNKQNKIKGSGAVLTWRCTSDCEEEADISIPAIDAKLMLNGLRISSSPKEVVAGFAGLTTGMETGGKDSMYECGPKYSSYGDCNHR